MDTPVRPGDVLLGKYKVERLLGRGGMGVVVAARHIELGELFAIKFLLPAMLDHGEAIERFLREARAAARLRSEHVARVHDVGRMEDGAPYMILEYLDGSDLKAQIRRQGPLSIEEAVMYVLQACDAIAEAHAAGIIHRDLKPANLFLIRRPNGSSSVKVLDFGISKRTGPDEVELTGTGALLGSPMYMSPEQMARTKAVDVRTDIWALGVVLYELVIGRAPFLGQTITEVVSSVLQEDPAAPSRLRPEIPEGLDAAILHCLHKRPGDRFQSIGELASALREALGWTVGAGLGGVLPSMARPPLQSAPSLSAVSASRPTDMRAEPSTAEGVTLPLPPSPLRPVAALREPDPVTEPLPAPGTATTAGWGRTGAATSPSSRGKVIVAVGATLGVLVVGAGSWFGVRALSEPAVVAASAGAPPAVETAQPVLPPTAVMPAPSAPDSTAASELRTPEPAAPAGGATPPAIPSSSAAPKPAPVPRGVQPAGTIAPQKPAQVGVQRSKVRESFD